MKRSAVVADRFYPGSRSVLRSTLDELIPAAQKKQKALGVVSPHAGYIYSGGVAGETLGQVTIPETVVILGPNHSGRGKTIALSTSTWEMALGDVSIDMSFAEKLLADDSPIEQDDTAHAHEHSLEVQLPFLQLMQENLKIVPLCISHIPYEMCEAVARVISHTIKEYDDQVLLLASNDMSHFESRESAQIKDRMALDKLLGLDPKGLYDTVLTNGISMCGIMPVTVMLLCCLQLGATEAKLVRYTDSGEMSGDTSQVVGYAGVIIS